MSKTTSTSRVTELARATLKRLAELHLGPTPDNYARIFNEMAQGAGSPPPAGG